MVTGYFFTEEKEGYMNRLFRRLLAVTAAAAMFLGIGCNGCVDTVAAARTSYEGDLVVIHTNDIHGHFDTVEGKQLGMAAVASLKQYYEGQGANVLLLDAGDFSQGTTLVSYFDGGSSVLFMNAAGYDAATLGNHEFDFGFEELQIMDTLADFPILDANILDKETGEPYFEDNKIFAFDNMKVGVFGLDTAEAQTKASPKNVKDITILDGQELYACAQEQVNTLKAQGCDYIICLGHLGVDDESVGRRSVDVAANTTGIDLFVDGHSHTEMDGGLEVNGTVITSIGNYLANIGVVVYDQETKTEKASLVKAADYKGGYDATVAGFVKAHQDIVDAAYSGLFATAAVDLNGEREPGVRTQETNLGDFAADAYLYAAQQYMGDAVKVDGAIQNGGGVRASIPAGPITMNTLYTVFPFGNSVSVVKVTGAQLLEALEASCSAAPAALGGFPQVSGIVFTIDTSIPYVNGLQYPDSTYFAPAVPGSRVTITSVGGRDFSLTDSYYIAVNNFMADGGDTYYVFTQAQEVIDTGVIDAEGLISYVNSLGGVIGDTYAAPKGNITIK